MKASIQYSCPDLWCDATYELQNIRTQQTYSRKLSLNVLNLTQIDRATEEDKNFGIDQWAALFRATTWEELRMITKNNEYMDDGAQVLLTMNSDQTIRDMCYFRERAEIEEKYRNDLIKKQETELAEKTASLQNYRLNWHRRSRYIKLQIIIAR